MSRAEQPWDPTKARLHIARDLREIERMFAALRAEAVNRAGDPWMPGGSAMNLLGPGAHVEAWGYVRMSAHIGRLDIWGTAEVDAIVRDNIEPPLAFLASWVDIVRTARGQDTPRLKPTIRSEILYLRSALDWMTATNEHGEPWFIEVEQFAHELHRVRTAMETALHDGRRADRINAECYRCPEAPRLCVHYGETEADDRWYCPNCDPERKHLFDVEDVARCWRQMLVRRPDAPEWVTVKQAAAALGRPIRSVRSWTLPPRDAITGEPNPTRKARVETRRIDGQPLLVKWADCRAIDDVTRRRNRDRARA